MQSNKKTKYLFADKLKKKASKIARDEKLFILMLISREFFLKRQGFILKEAVQRNFEIAIEWEGQDIYLEIKDGKKKESKAKV